MLGVYKNRRVDYRIRGVSTFKINLKIRSLNRAIRRLNNREEEIKKIYNHVIEFTGKSPQSDLFSKRAFYRYGMENRINGKFLSVFLGADKDKINHKGTKARMSLIRNKEQNELYKRFLKYVEDGVTI